MNRSHPRSLALIATLAVLLGACTGAISGDQGAPATRPEPPIASPAGSDARHGPAPVVRRLSRLEYDNTVRDLLGDTSRYAQGFLLEQGVNGFFNNSSAQTIDPVLAEQYLTAAERLAQAFVETRLNAELPCAPSETAACGRGFLVDFGKRAWRRPLTTAELEILQRIYDEGAQEGGLSLGVSRALQTMLVSAPFLYRIETRSPDAAGPRRPTGWEMASRLSYLLWGSLPDAELFDAAARNELQTAAQVRRQTERMIKDARARQMVAHFQDQWLRLRLLSSTNKDQTLFPQFTTAVRTQLRAELDRFLDHVVWSGAGGFERLYQSNETFVDATLAKHYGLPAGAGSELTRVAVDGRKRAGLLGMGGIMAMLASAVQTSPTQRGRFVREQLLCQSVPDPPPEVDVTPRPSGGAASNARERLAEHVHAPGCATCHRLIDPIGFALESFDAIGRIRDQENGKPLDLSGEVVDTAIGRFVGEPELAKRLAGSQDTRDCFARQWFRFASGRTEVAEDAATIGWLAERLTSSRGNLAEFLVELTQTPTFLTVSAHP